MIGPRRSHQRPRHGARPDVRFSVLAPTALVTAVLAAAMTMGGCRALSSAVSSPTTRPGPTVPAATAAPSVAPSTRVAPTPTATTAAPTTTTRPTPPITSATTAPTVAGPVQVGSTGPSVVQLQQRLTSLGYWLGAPDGQFGTTTQQAVFALEKAAGLPRTGIMDSATLAALAAGTKATARSTAGHTIEVDLTRQLLLIVTDGRVDGVLNTSTGGGYVYYDQGARQVAITPTGHFATFSEVDGTRISSLGVLWRPKFFVGGIAIHGDSSVPARPVSHGCVRVSNQAIDWIWATGLDPIGTPIWVY